MAEIAIDLYAMSCVLARATRSIEEKGAENDDVKLEIAIAEAFFMRANRRIRGNLKMLDKNDDEFLKFISSRAYELGRYPFETI